MRIAIACDHAGFPLKNTIIEAVRSAGHVPIDYGTNSLARVDYPDFVVKAGHAIQKGEADRAIVICGSGVGACITANKMKGIYAAICHDTYSAHQGVEHDDMNVLCLGARIIGSELAGELVHAFLQASFSNEERHIRRVEKIRNLENRTENDNEK
jgi:ribose 5-phosphate isomerase B